MKQIYVIAATAEAAFKLFALIRDGSIPNLYATLDDASNALRGYPFDKTQWQIFHAVDA